MKARGAVLFEPGTPLEVCDVDVAAPRAGEALVRMAAAGVCHTDLHVMQGKFAAPLPAVLGHEGAGVVAGVVAFQHEQSQPTVLNTAIRRSIFPPQGFETGVPVGTIPAFSTMRITQRSGARVRCTTPRGTTKPCRGSNSIDRPSRSMMKRPSTT